MIIDERLQEIAANIQIETDLIYKRLKATTADWPMASDIVEQFVEQLAEGTDEEDS